MRSRRLLLSLLLLLTATAAQAGGLLSEAPLAPVPEEMTWEEYRDANRRLLPAVLVSAAVPVPGMMHFQAGEEKTGWMLLGGAAVGSAAILSAAALAGDETYVDTDYSTVDINGIRYERIPLLEEESGGTTTTTYHLRELRKEREMSGFGAALLVTGVALLTADYLYDWIHGIHVIQEKRDRVRYKYGRQLRLGVAPSVEPRTGAVGVGLALRF